MESSGNGDGVLAKSDAAPTVVSSQPSQPKGKRAISGTRKQEQFGPSEALEFLESALAYCQRAGLVVACGNRPGKLIINISGAQYDAASTGSKFVPVLAQAMEGEA